MSKDEALELDQEDEYEPDQLRDLVMTPTSLTIAGLFVVLTALTFLASPVFAFLLVIPVVLSMNGLRGSSGSSGRLRTTGEIMIFNGVVLMLSLLIVGFIRDFLLAEPAGSDQAVAFAYTTVHVMLGLGLFLFDFKTLRAKTGDG